MSEGPDLATPAAADTPAAEAAPAPAPAASATDAATELATPEPKAVEGEPAAAAGQGDGKGAADGGASEGEAAKGEDGEAAATGAPESYADFTLPDGVQMDPVLGADLTTLAKELNLPQAQAQKLVDIGVKQAQAFQTAMKSSVEAAKTQWAEEVRSDPVLGGANLATSMSVAKKAMVAFGSPELVGLMNETGLSQHPALLRLLYEVGSAISEDTLVDGGASSGTGGKPAIRDHAKRMYPKMA